MTNEHDAKQIVIQHADVADDMKQRLLDALTKTHHDTMMDNVDVRYEPIDDVYTPELFRACMRDEFILAQLIDMLTAMPALRLFELVQYFEQHLHPEHS